MERRPGSSSLLALAQVAGFPGLPNPVRSQLLPNRDKICPLPPGTRTQLEARAA